MTNFDKTKFDFGGTKTDVWVSYLGDFVARFRYSRPKTSTKNFVNFLVDNFTVEEYFGKLKSNAPLLVAKEKGYVDLNTRIIKGI